MYSQVTGEPNKQPAKLIGEPVKGTHQPPLCTTLPLWCRYVPGQHFGKHVDDSVEASPGCWTKYTLLIYLSDKSNGLRGGETAFFGARGTV